MNIRLLDNIPLISNKAKLKISISLLIFALVTCIVRSGSLDSIICLVAMFFSSLGDIALNCKPLDKRSHTLLYIGAFFFMIAHLIYASAYHLLINTASFSFANPGMYAALTFMILLFIVSIICIRKAKKSMKLSMVKVLKITIN